MTQPRIYLDFAATSPLRSEALAAMLPYLDGPVYNPSSLHFEGRRARAALEEARERIARTLGAARKEIVFCASGSEANSLGILGLARGRKRGHVVGTSIEHQSVLAALDALRDDGFDVTIAPVNASGFVDEAAFTAALRSDTILATCMYANNEIGTLQPVERLAAAATERGIAMHCDAVAAAGWLPIDVAAISAETIALAAHKFGGPTGFAALYVRDGVDMRPLVLGGGQERGRRAGTENVAAAVGTAVALELADAERLERNARVQALRDRLERGLLAIAGARANGGPPRLPNIENLSFEGVWAEALAARLDLEGIAVSPGSACTSGVAEPSHVARALQNGDPREAVRISLGGSTTQEEIDSVLQVMRSVVTELRRS
ncbi:MAG: cysteine desulfurase family protein [Candidatus Tyrphobacter sp.]